MIWKLSEKAKANQSKVDFSEISKKPKQSKVGFQKLQIRGRSKAKQSKVQQSKAATLVELHRAPLSCVELRRTP